MATFLFAFRGSIAPNTPAADESRWQRWFQDIGPSIADRGHRVGQYTSVSSGGVSEADEAPLTGFIQVRADTLEGAVELAEGCPILEAGGRVEVGETVD